MPDEEDKTGQGYKRLMAIWGLLLVAQLVITVVLLNVELDPTGDPDGVLFPMGVAMGVGELLFGVVGIPLFLANLPARSA